MLLKMRASGEDSASGWVSKSIAPVLSRFPEVRVYKPPKKPFLERKAFGVVLGLFFVASLLLNNILFRWIRGK